MLKVIIFIAAFTLHFSAKAESFNFAIESFMVEGALNQCTIPEDADFKLDNVTTEEIIEDQGVRDYIYTAVFTVSYLGKDEQTQVTKKIRVRAAKYAISNPAVPSLDLLSVTSTDKRICN